jgi:hypothetical protein
MISVKVVNQTIYDHSLLKFNPIPDLKAVNFAEVYGDSFISGRSQIESSLDPANELTQVTRKAESLPQLSQSKRAIVRKQTASKPSTHLSL